MYTIGDVKNNLRILQSEARMMKYSGDFDLDGLMKGNPTAFLPLYNHMFTAYNGHFAAQVLEVLDDNLFMKSDVRFMEGVYRIMRDLFNFKPSMTKEQFFTVNNFAERKIIMCVEVMRLVQSHCRYLGPKNPTNPNIRVTSIVDTGRCNKKSCTDLVTSEPTSEGALSRKVSAKDRSNKPPSALTGVSDNGWQVKVGYLRPHVKDSKGRDSRKENNSLDSLLKEEEARRDKSGVVANVVREFSPTSLKTRPMEVGHVPQDKQDKGHMRVMEAVPKAHSQPPTDWDPTGAVECILAKVRDLPAQLTNFMKAVESRLQKIEERLHSVESKVSIMGPPSSEDQRSKASEVKQHVDTLHQRLLLLDNKVALLEAKVQSSGMAEGIKTMAAVEEKKEIAPNPFVSLERGESRKPILQEDLFSGSLVSTFSPIRQELGDFPPSVNDSLASIADRERRLSSTPNQSLSATATPQNTSSTAEREKRAEVNVNNTTITWENLDTSTMQQVDRIRDMLKATQGLLPSTSPQLQTDT